jgi:hypothetical protein
MHAAQRFISAFNAQDHEALAQTLNYPHVRLAGGRFVTVESSRDFAELSRKGETRLAKEGWDHTEIESISAAQVGDDKVHLAMRINRCREDGSVYNGFDTMWIATLADGHWGIQFRSSFLPIQKFTSM